MACERPVAIAQQNRKGGGGGNRRINSDGEILDMIVIEIAHGERKSAAAGTEDQWRPECPISVSQQHRDAASYVGRHEVLTAIAIEIAHRDSFFPTLGRIRNPSIERQWRPECPVSISQQHRNTTAAVWGYRKVLKTVAIEIADDDGHVQKSEPLVGKFEGGWNVPFPLPSNTFDAVWSRIGDEILNPIAVELTHGEAPPRTDADAIVERPLK